MTDRKIQIPTKRMSDVVPSGNPWPKLEEIDIDGLLNHDYVLLDAQWRNGKHGQFVYIQLADTDTGAELVTRTGGKVVVDKLHQWQEKGSPPVLVTITQPGDYYDIQ